MLDVVDSTSTGKVHEPGRLRSHRCLQVLIQRVHQLVEMLLKDERDLDQGMLS